MLIKRLQEKKIKEAFDKKKAIVIMGPRQVGKSTLLHQMFRGDSDVLWLNGDEADNRAIFEDFSSTKMALLLGNKSTLVVDEAQRIPNIGLDLKIIIDNLTDKKVVATGSSSFELAASINESLAGRKREFTMFPLTFEEMVNHTDLLIEKRMLHHRMVYGYYPEVVTTPGDEKEILRELTNSYLYKDLLAMGFVRKPDVLMKLVKALAYQVGSQVSFNELSKLVGVDIKTISRYVDILEKCYVVFSLGSFSRNLRNELKTSKKIYFWDTGIRNAVIGNFAPLENRSPEECGALWENFMIAERLKFNNIRGFYGQEWFWRTKMQAEIDYLEEEDGVMTAYEFKFNPHAKAKMPQAFFKAYPDIPFQVVTPENYEEFLLPIPK